MFKKNDCSYITSAVYRGRKASNKTKQTNPWLSFNTILVISAMRTLVMLSYLMFTVGKQSLGCLPFVRMSQFNLTQPKMGVFSGHLGT